MVDVRDQPCPNPMLIVKKAMRTAQAGELFEVIVNDRLAKENVLSFCWNRGEEVMNSWEDEVDFHLLIRKSSTRNPNRGWPFRRLSIANQKQQERTHVWTGMSLASQA